MYQATGAHAPGLNQPGASEASEDARETIPSTSGGGPVPSPTAAAAVAARGAPAALAAQQPGAAPQHRAVQLLESMVCIIGVILHLLIWWRTATAAPHTLSPAGHAHQAMYLALILGCLLLLRALPHGAWLRYRVLIVSATRLGMAFVPAQRSTVEGTALLTMQRPPMPGWRGVVLDGLRLLLGTRVLGTLCVPTFFVQPPLAVLLQQLARLTIIGNNRDYCATPPLTHPLSRSRLKTAWWIFEASPTLVPVPALPGIEGPEGSENQCVAVLAMLQALMLMLVLIITAHMTAAMLPRTHPAGPQQLPQYTAGWHRIAAAAVAAAGRAWDWADRELSMLCRAEGYPSAQLAICAYMFTGVLWLLCKVIARNVEKCSSDPLLANVPNKLFIGGEWVDAASGKTFPVLDPRTAEEIFRVAEADAADVDKAVAAARKAFDEGPWPRMSGKQRGKIMLKLAELIEANAEEMAKIESLDNGKPLAMSKLADIPLSADHFRYFGGWADKLHGKTIPCDNIFGKFFAYTLHEPIGVVGQIIPWNFPLLMLAWKVAPALAAGNCIVLKPAEQTPLNALRFATLCQEAGIPAGTINILPGYGPTAGARICRHPDVDKLAFTGSTEVGRIVMNEAAKRIVPCSLELGGKSPLIVDKSVDVDKAVEQAHFACFFNHGQCCAAGTRTYVHADIYDEFVQKSAERAQKRVVGDPFADGTEQGPQVDEDQLNKILSYLDIGQREGARLMCGGKRHGDKGYFVEPTVFADVTEEMRICKEEIFGPVQSILKFHTTEEVIKRANQNEYGLASGILSNDVNFINTVSRALKAGTVWVNTYNVYESGVPFGGYKSSGVGRDKGEYALEAYTQVKAVYQALEDDQCWL